MNLDAMRQGGKALGQVKQRLVEATHPGITLLELDTLADKWLRESGGKPAFQLVPGYHWATCININDGIVHGIPTEEKINEGDIVTLDVGLYYQGLNTDTSVTIGVGKVSPIVEQFLAVGRKTLKETLKQVKNGNRVWDISNTIQTHIEKSGYSVVRNLTGHGVGAELHMDPPIPCYVYERREETPRLKTGQTLAIEVMYCQGDWLTTTDADGWTIRTQDGKLSAVFEETVIVLDGGCEVITK